MGLFDGGRVWQLINDDSSEVVQGDFEALGVTRNVSASYNRHTALNRQNAITQFIGGNADTLTFQARLLQRNALVTNATEKYEKLVEWTERDKKLGRPPIVLFSIGDGSTAYFGGAFATIDSISDAVFDTPTILGHVRGVTFTVNLTKFVPYDIERQDTGGNTRFHKVKEGEYMEMLAFKEYGDPLLGDVIRRKYPQLQTPVAGDTVGLPAIELVRDETIEPKSAQLAGLRKRKDNANKTLFKQVLDRHNTTYRSKVIPVGW